MFFEVNVKTDRDDVDLGSCWVQAEEAADAEAVAVDKLWDPRLTSGGASPVTAILQEWDPDYDYDAKSEVELSGTAFREAARKLKEREGELEIDDNAIISRGSDGGAYVQAWVWIDTEAALRQIAEKAEAPAPVRGPKP